MDGTKGRTVSIHQGSHLWPKMSILPAVDGSLALKQDTSLPGTSQKHLMYKSHPLE